MTAATSDLGVFLRARREALRPADVGLVDNGRRRTPGLRREEVAALAGVSIDYLTRLEQGRDMNPSASVLAALATALRLDDGERAHMAKLATLGHSRELCPEPTPFGIEVARGVRHLLDDLATTPAFVIGPIGDVIAWNEAWARVVAALGLLDGARPNLVRYAFLDARSRDVFADWNRAADEQVANLRVAEPRWRGDPAFVALLDELLAVDEFTTRWSTHPVGEKQRGTKRLVHPEVGALEVAYDVLALEADEQRLIVWRGADEATVAHFATLAGRHRAVSPAQLSVVVNR